MDYTISILHEIRTVVVATSGMPDTKKTEEYTAATLRLLASLKYTRVLVDHRNMDPSFRHISARWIREYAAALKAQSENLAGLRVASVARTAEHYGLHRIAEAITEAAGSPTDAVFKVFTDIEVARAWLLRESLTGEAP